MRWRIDDRSRRTSFAMFESRYRAIVELTISFDFAKSFCATISSKLVNTFIWSPTIGVKLVHFEGSVWNELPSPVKMCLIIAPRNSCACGPCSDEWMALKSPSSQLVKTSPRCPSSLPCALSIRVDWGAGVGIGHSPCGL